MKPEDVPDGPLNIDTNALKHLLRQAEADEPWLKLVQGHFLAISFATYGEQLALAIKNKWGEQRLAGLEAKLNDYEVISGSILVAREYARLQATFGTSQQRNDLWVAACSLAQPTPFPVVTNDGDFDRIAEKFPALIIVRPDETAPGA